MSDEQVKPFSVLLLYPEDINEGGGETYYDLVEAVDVEQAVRVSQLNASDANKAFWNEENDEAEERESLADDFKQILVIAGHHEDLGHGI